MPIAMPKKDVQDVIALTIESIDNKIDNQKNNYNVKNSIFKTLLHELMTGERRVNEIEFESLNKEYKIKEEQLSIAAEK